MQYERQPVSQPLYGTVNVYRIGDTLVDTGHVTEASRTAIAAALDGGILADVERVVLTHPHIDHVGGSQTLPEIASLPHIVFEGVPPIITDFRGHLERVRAEIQERSVGLADDRSAIDESYFPLDDYAEDDIRISRVVEDGETVRVGAYECEVVPTPGHSAHQMALWHTDSNTMFSADLVSRNGHFMYGPLYGDIGAYIDSLRRLRAYEADRLLPGHGPVITNPRPRIEAALTKAREALTGIKTAVEATDEPIAASQLASAVFEATEGTVGFLTLVVCEYLEYLEAEGEVVVSQADDGIFAVSG